LPALLLLGEGEARQALKETDLAVTPLRKVHTSENSRPPVMPTCYTRVIESDKKEANQHPRPQPGLFLFAELNICSTKSVSC
jgi:hypothetical protein